VEEHCRSTAILSSGKEREQHYIFASSVARKWLAVLASSAASELVFSSAGVLVIRQTVSTPSFGNIDQSEF
jgi:hypothetical protein